MAGKIGSKLIIGQFKPPKVGAKVGPCKCGGRYLSLDIFWCCPWCGNVQRVWHDGVFDTTCLGKGDTFKISPYGPVYTVVFQPGMFAFGNKLIASPVHIPDATAFVYPYHLGELSELKAPLLCYRFPLSGKFPDEGEFAAGWRAYNKRRWAKIPIIVND